MIRKATIEDAATIASIYNYFILNSTVTFEETVVDEKIIVDRMNTNEKLNWWVYEKENQILGYAYATYWKPRTAYRFTLETSVYVSSNHHNKGIGKQIYTKLILELKALGFHTLLAGISLPNKVSIRFHENLGFRKVGQLEKVGFKFNRWIDVGYWELNL
ncbi:GNAT family N-acetyltransferase [Flavobacteriaceae bacterium]|nr:GNAT family N-acetyltransferase [Flavobacteriaceae bacterium]MDA7797494.1 GNAT family N-acetyltransferase [Flavobacteriaceae bacterium]MDB3863141.1 GNAT family N-acetyltransferase [Flavobacteriaceae bacterium]